MSIPTTSPQLWAILTRPRILAGLKLNVAPFATTHTLTSRSLLDSIISNHSASDRKVDDTPASRANRQPYPPGPLNTALFEEVKGDYLSLPTPALSKKKTSTADLKACHVLVRLVSRGDFSGAEIARKELENLGIPIDHDTIYLDAALHALDNSQGRDGRAAFLGWWALIPRRQWKSAFSDIQAHLLEHPVDLDLLSEFSLLCADNRFSYMVGKTLVPHIIRYSEVSFSTKFLDVFVTAARNNSDTWTSTRVEKDTWYNLAIRTHALAGRRIFAAEMLLRHARSKDFMIEPPTFYILLEKLKEFGHHEHMRHVTDLILSKKAGEEFERPLEQHYGSALVATMSRHGNGDPPTPSSMASALRLLRNTIASDQPRPFASFLADFLYTYDKVYKRRRAFHLLRNKVFKTKSRSVAAQWVAGEQLYYSSRRRPVAVLRTFLHYCSPESFPAAEAQRVVDSYDDPANRRRFRWAARDWDLSRHPYTVAGKIWPLKINLGIAWQALVQLTTNPVELERLYEIFLTQLSTTAEAAITAPDAAYFQSFIFAFSWRIGPRRGARVFADMQRLGISPTTHNWAVLAAAYARSGDITRTETILRHIEGSWDIQENNAKARWTKLCTYNFIMRGFVDSGMYVAARDVQRRMTERGLFDSGVDKRSKSILHRLRRHEQGKEDHMIRRKRKAVVNGQVVYADPNLALWNESTVQ